MKQQTHSIAVANKGDIDSIWLIPEHYQAVLLIAHGAGSDMHSPFISFLQRSIAEQGIMTVKFNFPYMQQGRRAPDRAPVLEATWLAVIDTVQQLTKCRREQLFLSGKSMGGRYASIIAAQQQGFGGLILYGYPLHPPGKPEKLRSEHLSAITCPMLFFQGTRDTLCKLDKLQHCLEQLDPVPELYIIDGGDHSFKVLKRLQRSEQSVWEEIARHSGAWIRRQL